MSASASGQQLVNDPASSEATVLVVDDYRSLAELIAAMLRAHGFRVLTTGSAEEAKALAQGTRIDLLLTDLEMPHMRGDELAAWFGRAKPEAQILFMASGRSAMPPVEPSRVLQKPLGARTLVRKVREILNHNAAPSENPATPATYGD